MIWERDLFTHVADRSPRTEASTEEEGNGDRPQCHASKVITVRCIYKKF